jgi:hypothetical protein
MTRGRSREFRRRSDVGSLDDGAKSGDHSVDGVDD